MLLRFGQSKPKPSQLQHHGKRAKQQILHDVAKMILYKAYHLRQGLGLIMVILHQQFRLELRFPTKRNQNLEFWMSNKKFGLFIKLLTLGGASDVFFSR